MLRAEALPVLRMGEEEHPRMRQLPRRRRAEPYQEVCVGKLDKLRGGVGEAEEAAGSRDFDGVEPGSRDFAGVAAPVDGAASNLYPLEGLRVHRHAVLADSALEDPLSGAVRRVMPLRHPDEHEHAFWHLQLTDFGVELRAGRVVDSPPEGVGIERPGSADGLGATFRPIRHAEHKQATVSVGEADGYLGRDLHGLPRISPRLELEPLCLEIVGRLAAIELVEEGQEVRRGRYHDEKPTSAASRCGPARGERSRESPRIAPGDDAQGD
jgi:hypothetical protein